MKALIFICLMTLLVSCSLMDVMQSPELMELVTELPGQIIEDLAEDVIEIDKPYTKYIMPYLITSGLIIIIYATWNITTKLNSTVIK